MATASQEYVERYTWPLLKDVFFKITGGKGAGRINDEQAYDEYVEREHAWMREEQKLDYTPLYNVVSQNRNDQ